MEFTLSLMPLVLLGLVTGGCASSSRYYGIDLSAARADSTDLQELARQARSGDKHAQLELGMRFEEGRGVPTDLEKAGELFGMAAEDTQLKQTTFVSTGGGVEPQTTYTGIRKGLAEAAIRLAMLPESNEVYFGIALSKSTEVGGDAFELEELAKRAHAGEEQAQLELGVRFDEGRIVKKDQYKAHNLFALAGKSAAAHLNEKHHGFNGAVARHYSKILEESQLLLSLPINFPAKNSSVLENDLKLKLDERLFPDVELNHSRSSIIVVRVVEDNLIGSSTSLQSASPHDGGGVCGPLGRSLTAIYGGELKGCWSRKIDAVQHPDNSVIQAFAVNYEHSGINLSCDAHLNHCLLPPFAQTDFAAFEAEKRLLQAGYCGPVFSTDLARPRVGGVQLLRTLRGDDWAKLGDAEASAIEDMIRAYCN